MLCDYSQKRIIRSHWLWAQGLPWGATLGSRAGEYGVSWWSRTPCEGWEERCLLPEPVCLSLLQGWASSLCGFQIPGFCLGEEGIQMQVSHSGHLQGDQWSSQSSKLVGWLSWSKVKCSPEKSTLSWKLGFPRIKFSSRWGKKKATNT
jgi:hypothetical protein